MSETEGLRATIMQEADTYGSKRRFGLFSSPVSTAIGDDGQYKTKLRILHDIQTPKINKENQSQSQGIFIRILHARANSTNPIFRASTLWQKSRTNISTLERDCFNFKMKPSRRALLKSKCSSQRLDSKISTLLPMILNKKTILKKILRETETLMEK